MGLWRQTDWLGSMLREQNRSQKTTVVRVPAMCGANLLSHPFAHNATAVSVGGGRIWQTFPRILCAVCPLSESE